MFTLPRGAPVLAKVPTSREGLPTFLGRLAQTQLTGYAQFDFAASVAVLVFFEGKLLSVALSRGGVRVTNLDALNELCRRVAAEEGTVDVYRLEKDLTLTIDGLLHGEPLLKDQLLRGFDVRGLTAQLKAQRFNGCIRVHAQGRTSLVFYKDGVGFGFFHDGSDRLETTATESQKIANLPGALMDVLALRPLEQLQRYDMLEVVNLERLWETTVRSVQAEYDALHAKAEEARRAQLVAAMPALEATLKGVAHEVLGPMGQTLVSKELMQLGGPSALLTQDKLQQFAAGVERGAKLLAGPSKVKDLQQRMAAEIAKVVEGNPSP